MARQKEPSGNEARVLAYLLKAGNYKPTSVEVLHSDVIRDLGLDIPELVRAVRSMSTSGFIRLSSLPQELEASYASQVFDDLDMLDLRYLEDDITESEYISARQAVADQLNMFPRRAEPFSPVEASHLFHEFNMRLGQILTESPQQSRPCEALEGELLAIRKRLLPFRRFVLSRIGAFTSRKEQRPDSPKEKRIRMLILFSQVGMSQLIMAKDVSQDLLEELEILRARHLLGEISQSELEDREKALWNEILKRLPPQLPDQGALAAWARQLTTRLEILKLLRQRGVVSKGFFQTISEDLHEAIALLEPQSSHTS